MALDVLVILIVFESFQNRRARAAEVARQREIIDDYKRWDAEEARLRIAGAIRRLNRHGIVKLDLAGAVLSDFEFAKAGIRSLAGSTFYDGSWGNPYQDASIRLTRVSFSWVDCTGVEFSPFDPFEALIQGKPRSASLTDCDFLEADLRDATFNGSDLIWSESPPEDLYDYEDDDEGQPGRIQKAYSRFDGAQLAGASFRGCVFRNVDFRGADDVRLADFFRAEGLEGAKFDSDEDREHVLASATRRKERAV